jgi:hypothetical protein
MLGRYSRLARPDRISRREYRKDIYWWDISMTPSVRVPKGARPHTANTTAMTAAGRRKETGRRTDLREKVFMADTLFSPSAEGRSVKNRY